MSDLKNCAIGIFDSGIGGLIVANEISRLLPNEKIVYVGDTAHAPWGDKSPRAITQYATKITEFLSQQACKAIVIACNTASCITKEAILAQVGTETLVLDVIEPVLEHLKAHYHHCQIGLLGTKRTIQSQTYQKRIQALGNQLTVNAIATPILVPLIEEGFAHHPATKQLLFEYLQCNQLLSSKALILGCTHYPLIEADIKEIVGHHVNIINSAALVAKALQQALNQRHLLATPPSSHSPERHFYISDLSECFEQMTDRLFPKPFSLERLPLWE